MPGEAGGVMQKKREKKKKVVVRYWRLLQHAKKANNDFVLCSLFFALLHCSLLTVI